MRGPNKQSVLLRWIAGMALAAMLLPAVQADAGRSGGVIILEIPYGYIIIPMDLTPTLNGDDDGEHSPDPPPPPPKGGNGAEGEHSPDPPPPPG